MLFVRIAILLSALVFSTAESLGACQELVVAGNLVKASTRGWQVVGTFLRYDWKARDMQGPATYPLVVEMPRPARARASSDFWIQRMYACTEVQAADAKSKKREWVQYDVKGWPGEQEGAKNHWVWYGAPLLLPTDVVARRGKARALIAGVEYPGRWVKVRGKIFLGLEPPKKKKGSN